MWEMQVQIDKARHDEVRTMVFFFHIFGGGFFDVVIVADGGDLAIINQQTAIFDVKIAFRVIDGVWCAAKT
ncbi:hypothetical protein D3C80_1946740 [compost metagenome]